jgi:hypothetical protein
MTSVAVSFGLYAHAAAAAPEVVAADIELPLSKRVWPVRTSSVVTA